MVYKSENSLCELTRVSVIIATFECRDELEECLIHLGALRSYPIEVIVVDGGSKDGSREVLNTSSVCHKYLSEPDDGIYDAWNKGVELAAGEYICFLGATDRLEEDWIGFVCGDHTEDIVFGSTCTVDDTGSHGKVVQYSEWSAIRAGIRSKMGIPIVGTMFKRHLFQDRKFDTNFKIIGDWDFIYRLNDCTVVT